MVFILVKQQKVGLNDAGITRYVNREHKIRALI